MPLSSAFLDLIEPLDAFVLAFPRSGSRWLRHLLTDLSHQWLGLDLHTLYSRTRARELHLESDTLIPDAHSSTPRRSTLLGHLGRGVYRSHHLVEVLRRSEGPKIFMARHPAATLYSYYSVARERGWIPPDISQDTFCMWKLPVWVDHIRTILEHHATRPDEVLFLDYQQEQPLELWQLQLAAESVGIPVSPQALEGALGRLAAHLQVLNSKADKAHPRGTNQNILELLGPSLLDRINTEAGPWYSRFQELAAATQPA